MTFSIVFPGQGSQSIGMLSALAQQHPIVEQTFSEASQVLGYDLWQIVQSGTPEQLEQTTITQPAMLAGGVAVWRVLEHEIPLPPVMLAGHSLGEYTALVVAGVIDFASAIELVALRGRLMQEAVPPGEGMMVAVLGVEDEKIITLCQEATQGEEVASPANFNCPGQVVIAGATPAVQRAIELARAGGAKKVTVLPVSVPSHSPLMKKAAEAFSQKLAMLTLSTPFIPVVQNVNSQIYQTSEEIRQAIIAQLYSPIHWGKIVHLMVDQGISTILEVGPGKVLTGLNRRIIPKNVTPLSVYDPDTLALALETLHGIPK